MMRAISQVLSRQLSDPRIRGMVSVTKVDVSPDLANADVYVSVIPEEHGSLTLKGLNSAAGRIHTAIFKSLALRRVPRMQFILDDSLKRQAEVDRAIHNGLNKEQHLAESYPNAKQGDEDAQATDTSDEGQES